MDVDEGFDVPQLCDETAAKAEVRNRRKSTPGMQKRVPSALIANFPGETQEMLSDPDIRSDVFPALEAVHAYALLERFEPDDYSPEPVSTLLLQSLKQQVRLRPPLIP